MLYLEDYLEMIEHLPAELRDRFTDMREIDLSVQNRIDTLGERQKVFFANCSKKFKASERDQEFEKIREEYKKVIEDSNEKVQGAEECYNLVDRYLRKLDEELLKFKLELEADNRGITEILEKQSLELDAPQPTTYKENKRPKKTKKASSEMKMTVDYMNPQMSTSKADKRQQQSGASFTDTLFDMTYSSPSSSLLSTPSFPIQQMGAGGSAIAAAATQAIAATQQLTGRRSSSLKASYEAIHMGTQSNDFGVGLTNFDDKKSKANDVSSPMSGGFLDVLGPAGLEGTTLSGDQDWNYDPNEPRYCICNQVSYGDMVACDNEDCPYEWFHYPCVGITAPPEGKWYCPTCRANMARRKGRKETADTTLRHN